MMVDMTKLSLMTGLSRTTLLTYLQYLHRARLIHLLYSDLDSLKKLQKAKCPQGNLITDGIVDVVGCDEGRLFAGNLLTILALATDFDGIATVNSVVGTAAAVFDLMLIG